MSGLTERGRSLDHANTVQLISPEIYLPLCKAAADRLPELDDHPHDLFLMLFSKDELEWLKSQYPGQPGT